MAAAAAVVALSTGAAWGDDTSDYTAGYVVLPKIVVAVTGGTNPPVGPGDQAVDTLIQMTNTNQAELIEVNCWWVNANGHCGSEDGPVCYENADCPLGQQCVPGWSVTDFSITLTPGQPIGFTASSGLGNLPCDPLFQGPGCVGIASGNIERVPENPFVGELKCVQVEDDLPVAANDLKVEATIISTTVGGGGSTTAAAYNGIGFRALSQGSTPVPGGPLCLGELPAGSPPGATCAASYEACPAVLHMEHPFDTADVRTEITLVPCSENLGDPAASLDFTVTAQMLVYNEFEQRFSTATRVACYESTPLSDIDTRPGSADDAFSVFSAGVQGTEFGQTRIRGVLGPQGPLGYGLIGVGCTDYGTGANGAPLASTAFNLQHSLNDRFADGDAVYYTTFPLPPP
jgi:hypothetical protein